MQLRDLAGEPVDRRGRRHRDHHADDGELLHVERGQRTTMARNQRRGLGQRRRHGQSSR